jgi:uncharacterized protein (UPF0332 family)
MNAVDFLTFASKLAAQPGNGPSGFRSAVSRAYYGAFHLAKEFLESQHFFCHSENQHQWAQKLFLNSGVQIGREIGQLLSNLHESRKLADYRLDKTVAETQANAQLCALRADEIRTRISQCNDVKVLPQLLVGISAYRKIIGES